MSSQIPADYFPTSTKQKMSRKMYHNFDVSSLQSIWRQIVSVVDIGGPNLCPIPFIEKPHYFDLLNVFVKMKKTPKQRMKGLVTNNNKYQFVAKLRDVIMFKPNDNKEKLAQILQLKDRTPASELERINDPYAKPVAHIIEGERDKFVLRSHELRINIPRFHVLHLEMDKDIKWGIDKKKPEFENAKYVLIVSEVYSCKSATVTSLNGNTVNVERYFLDNGPIPLAFAVLRVELDKEGFFTNMERCHPHRFFAEEHWSDSAMTEPKESEVIKVLSDGETYRVDESIKDSWSYISC